MAAKNVFSEKPSNPSRISIRWVAVYAATLTALIYQLNFHAAPDAPLRHFGVPPVSLQEKQALLAKSDQEFISVAGGQNALLQLGISDADKAINADLIATRYYSGVYAMYPQRIYIGQDDHIINNGQDMYAADRAPSMVWLQEHQVLGICKMVAMIRTQPSK